MIESTKVVSNTWVGYGETLAAKIKISHLSGSGESCLLPYLALVLSTVSCMRSVIWTLNQIWRHSLVQRTS